MKAWIGIREQPHYRRDAFASGLRACGYDVHFGTPTSYEPGMVYVSWNRYDVGHAICTKVEQAGRIALVAENGYIGPGGVSPHGMNPREWYALAIGGHNGQGQWSTGGPERWDALGVDLKPWRADGDHILVCPNRPFGRPGYAMAGNWAEDVAARLRAITKRPVRIRPHPGNDPARKPLAEDLAGAWACVIWSSSAGVQALVAGIPVICEAPAWIVHRAALGYCAVDDVARPSRGPRLPQLRRLAWAQWHVDEIATGEPFRHLLRPARQEEIAASA